MDDRESGHALSDAVLDRELEHALAVDPSPEFVARVRARIAHEPDRSWWPSRWILGAAGVAAVAIAVIAVVASRPEHSAQGSSPALPERVALTPPAISKPVAQDPPSLADRNPGELRRDLAKARSAAAAFSSARPAANTARARLPIPEIPSPGAALPEIIIAADEAAAFRRLISDVRLGRADLELVPDRPSVTVALQPPDEIAIAPLLSDASTEPVLPQGERQ